MLLVDGFVLKLKSDSPVKKTIQFYGTSLRKPNQVRQRCPKPLNQVTPEDVYRSRDFITSSDYAKHNHVQARFSGLELSSFWTRYQARLQLPERRLIGGYS